MLASIGVSLLPPLIIIISITITIIIIIIIAICFVYASVSGAVFVRVCVSLFICERASEWCARELKGFVAPTTST